MEAEKGGLSPSWNQQAPLGIVYKNRWAMPFLIENVFLIIGQVLLLLLRFFTFFKNMPSNNNNNKRVRFSQENRVELTYSQEEYDRSRLAVVTSTKHRAVSREPRDRSLQHDRIVPKPSSARQRPFIPPLDLSGIPNACQQTPVTDQLVAMAVTSQSAATSSSNILSGDLKKKQQQRRPTNLFIDTRSIREAPRFFTQMSTYYTCRSDEDSDKDIFWTPTTSSPVCY